MSGGKYYPMTHPIETASFERTVMLRDANVRKALELLEEDLMEILREYDEVTSIVGEKITKVLRVYDSSI